jgi:anti-anti-sigma factor
MMSASQWLSRLHVRAEGAGGTRILRLDGELNAESAPELRALLAESVARAGELILDLSGLRAMDADGVAAILSGCAGGRAMPVIVGMRPRVARVVQLAGCASRPPFA